MCQFIITGHGVSMTPDFSLDDITGGVGRLDVPCCCVNSTFFLSYDICEDAWVHLTLGDEYTVRFESSELRRPNPDEHPAAALIHKALEKREEVVGHMPAESSPGVSIRRMGPKTTLEEIASDATMVELHEDGDLIAQVEPPKDLLFVLPSHHDFIDGEAELLTTTINERVRFGPEILHADRSVMVAHNYLDTVDYLRY